MTNKKAMVIGLDGATWDLMRPWAEKGILPTFKRLMKNGVYGDLESTIPPFTIPAWTSFATGKNPGKIGYYDFLMPKKSLSDLKPITTKDIHGKTFYEVVNDNGKKCIIINLPGSYPPRIKEIVITSILTQGDNFIFPPELVNEIPEFKNYRIIPDDMSTLVNGRTLDFINDIRKLEKNRFECAKKLFERDWDFFFLLFSAPDWIQHSIYDKLVSGMFDENSDPVKAYKEIDGYIEWFMNNADDINILFMSDHGFTVYEKVFIVNNWLVKEGYLRVERGSKPELPRTIADKEIQKIKAERINIRVPNFLANHSTLIKLFAPLYKKLKKVLPIELQTAFQPVLSDTIAYSMSHSGSNFGGIYINDKERFIDGKVEISSYENIREEILDKLKQLEDPETGEKIILNYWKKEDVYSGPKLDIAPDIIFKLKDEYLVSLGYGINPYANKCIDKIGDIKSNHALQGIFLAYGPDVQKGVEIQNAKIYDLAPTILHIIGLPIPKDMDGRVLKEIFRDDSELAKRPVKFQEVDERERIKERMRWLKTTKNKKI